MDPSPKGPSAVVRCLALAAVAWSVCVGATACSNDDEPDPPSATLAPAPPTTASTEPADTTTTTTVEDVEADVEAAYLEATEAYYEALRDPDPDDDRLEIHRTEPSLTTVRRIAEDLRSAGDVVRYDRAGLPATEIESVKLARDAGTATVVSCTVDRSERVRTATGAVVDGTEFAARERFEMVFEEGEWRIADGKLVDEFVGARSCES